MEVEKFVGSLAFLILIVWFGKTLNSYSKEKYGYIPINLRSIFFGMIPYMIFITGFLLKLNGPLALSVGIMLASISVIGQFLWILNRSSTMVAAGSIILLTILGLPTILFLFFTDNNNNSVS